MLQFIRDRAQGWIAIAIVGMLILGLASFAWDAYFGPDPEVSVAKINGEKITNSEFQREYQRQRARIQSMIGGADINQLIPDEAQFKKNILKQMEDEELVLQAAYEHGFRVSNPYLAQQIQSIEAFQVDGQFNPELYQQWLRQNALSPGAFEEMLRQDALAQQYRNGILSTAWSTEQERNAILKKQEQRRDIGFVKVGAAEYISGVDVSDEDAEAFYEENSTRYSTPEQVSVEYIELSVAALGKDIKIDEEALRELYQEQLSDFGVPEERHVRHILLEVAGDASDEELNTVKKKAESLIEKIRAGESFEKMAKEHSDDIGSAKSGGDLGFLARDMMMDPAFADAAFALKKGQLSAPVKSAYGFHIIKLEQIKRGDVKSFDEVRGQLVKDYRQRQAEALFFEQSEVLANLVFENHDSLEPAAHELGLAIKSTPLFSRDRGVGIAANPVIRDAAFSDDVLIQGSNSEPKEVGANHLVVLRVKEHRESTVKPFTEVKSQIVKELKQQRAEEKAQAEGQAVLQAVTNGSGIKSLLKEKKLSWQQLGLVKRSDNAVDQTILAEAFRISRPEDGGVVYNGITLPSGDYVVVGVSAVNDGELQAVDEAQKQTIKSSRDRYYGTSELLGAMNDLRNGADIKEYPENL